MLLITLQENFFYPFKLLLFSLASKLHLPGLRFKMKKEMKQQGFPCFLRFFLASSESTIHTPEINLSLHK